MVKKIKKTDLVKKIAEKIILENIGGISRKDIMASLIGNDEILAENIPENTISTQLNVLVNENPNISRVGRGIFAPSKDNGDEQEDEQKQKPRKNAPNESAFYESFRDYLINDLNECVKAACLPNMRGNKKWGNPDIVGVQKPLPGHIVDFPIQIVSVEIKVTPNEIATAFGQAASYLIFSHKTYVVVPRTDAALADLDKLAAQAHMLGIGMVTFDVDKERPNYEIVIRARTTNPDMFYLNTFVDNIRKYNSVEFNDLFS